MDFVGSIRPRLAPWRRGGGVGGEEGGLHRGGRRGRAMGKKIEKRDAAGFRTVAVVVRCRGGVEPRVEA